jgi:hypothetical protein
MAAQSCIYGDYYLDVIATPASAEIQIAGRMSMATILDGDSAFGGQVS